MIPGMAKVSRDLSPDLTEQQLRRVEAMINSMTRVERRNPKTLNGSRKRRIAHGSGTSVQEINQLLAQFRQMQRMMKQLGGGKGQRNLLKMFGGLR